MYKKKILLVTSKYPYSKTESDGGLSTVGSIIQSIVDSFVLDILFVRKYSIDESEIEGVNKIIFEEIMNGSKNKFERRINNFKQISQKIIELANNYDYIIIVHASKAFGLEDAPKEILDKIILYPMFLACSYKESGEIVPYEYEKLEKRCIDSLKCFICPSNYDKNLLINYYNKKSSEIFVIPRSVSRDIMHSARILTNSKRILSIGNIKERKQPLVLLNIFKEVHEVFPEVKLVFAGEIQDKLLYEKCSEFIFKNKLNESVKFVGVVTQNEIANLINNSDINVCTSNLETFGRCVFEGMYGGLPTVVFDILNAVAEFVSDGNGIFFVKNNAEFVDTIIKLLSGSEFYKEQSQRAINSTDFIGAEKEKKELLRVLKNLNI